MSTYFFFAVIFVILLELANAWSFLCTLFGYLGGFYVITATAWHLTPILRRLFPEKRVATTGKAVLVTGCDTGFGFRTAIELDKLGFTVIAGCLLPEGEGALKLQETCSSKLKIVKLNVTLEEDTAHVITDIRENKYDLWAIVNNAGVGHNFFFEGGKGIDLFRQVFDVNVFGVLQVTKACLPLLRKAKGRVVNISSLLGRFTITEALQYAMSKHAVRSFSDGLRREMRKFDVKVICLEPSMYRTNIVDVEAFSKNIERYWSETADEVKKDYNSMVTVYNKTHHAFRSAGSTRLSDVTDAIVDALTLEEPEPFIWCGSLLEKLSLWFLISFPESVQDDLLTELPRVFFRIVRSYRARVGI